MNFNMSNLEYEFKDFIGIYKNAFTVEECKKSIELFEIYHKNGYTYDRNHLTEDNFLNVKNDLSIDVFPMTELDCNEQFIKSFHQRFYDYLYPIYNHQYPILQVLQKHGSKHIKIQKTFPSQGYHIWHCEHNSSLYSNLRILSWILYLNDVDEGGETEFIYQSIRFKPEIGTLILFPAYFTHTHRGNPPLSGEKYIATGWIEYLSTNELQGPAKIPNFKNTDKKKINYF